MFGAAEEKEISITDSLGTTRMGTLCYTFLPILQLKGDFSSEYSVGEVLVYSPGDHTFLRCEANVKWRGGSTNTANKHKRNYRIKFDTDTALLGMRDDNNWILDAGQADVFRMRNMVAMNLWNSMGSLPYYYEEEPRARLAVSGRMVEVFLNDEYQGVYNLSERLDRKQLRVKKVSQQDGIRGCVYQSKGWGLGQMYDDVADYSNSSETWYSMEAKYPGLNDCDTTDWNTLADAIHFVAASSNEVFGKEVADFFDIPVIVDFCLFGSVLNAYDNRGKNLCWAVYNKRSDKKLTLAPWDLDCTAGQRWIDFFDEKAISPDTIVFMGFNLTNRLKRLDVCQFNEQLAMRYAELRGGALSTSRIIGLYSDAFRQMKNSGAMVREERRWSGDSDIKGALLNIEEEYDYICNWIVRHMDAMDRALLQQTDTASIVPAPPSGYGEEHKPTYDSLQGMRLRQRPSKGIAIQAGKRKRIIVIDR